VPCGNLQTAYFDWCIIHTQQYASIRIRLRRYTAATHYTSSMAAATLVERMTSLSPYAQIYFVAVALLLVAIEKFFIKLC